MWLHLLGPWDAEAEGGDRIFKAGGQELLQGPLRACYSRPAGRRDDSSPFQLQGSERENIQGNQSRA